MYGNHTRRIFILMVTNSDFTKLCGFVVVRKPNLSMKKYLISGALMFLLTEFLQGQELYFKPILRYNQSVSAQDAPRYFDLSITEDSRGYGVTIPVRCDIHNFSLSSGFRYGGTLGYKFNKTFGVEFGLEYFRSKKTLEADEATGSYSIPGITDWKLQSINALPSFTFGRDFNNSALLVSIGPVIGVSWLDNSLYAKDLDKNNFSKTYALSKDLCLGYNWGFEYDYFLKPGFALLVECGMENYSYTPHAATLTEYHDYGNEQTEAEYISIKKIKYENEIRNYDPGSQIPEERIKETIWMNTVYFGIGVKYIFKGHEKN